MLDQTSVALAGTAVRRIHDVSRYEERVVRPRRRFLRRAAAPAPSAPQLYGELALQC